MKVKLSKKLIQHLKNAVNDYIESCAIRQLEPEKPFKGSLNIRIGRELHEKAALVAKEIGCSSLNEFIKQALDHEVKRYA